MSVLDTTHVVIVGGGFAGTACAAGLAHAKDIQVTLLDRAGQHQFQPLLYQVATAELTPDDIVFDAQLLATAGAELRAFLAWAEEFYIRPHHRSADLLDAESVDRPRIPWGG